MRAEITRATQKFFDELAERLGLGSFTLCNTDAEVCADPLFPCATCGEVLSGIELALNDYYCPVCLSTVCVMCGCTDDRPCANGCRPVTRGLCSSHGDELNNQSQRIFGRGV